jgi:ElaB/YqjD/DUF883 family membrane-anchored ribosome-binding protein
MDKREHRSSTGRADVERRTEAIRQDIAQGGANISQTVEQLGLRIQEKLDWREYVKASPYLTLGAAAGLGCLAWGLLRERTTPTERLVRIIADKVGDSLGGLHAQAAGPGLIKATLLAIAVKTAVGWLQNDDSTATPVDDAGKPS